MIITEISFKGANNWVGVYDSQPGATRANVIELLSRGDYVIAHVEWAKKDHLGTKDLYGFIVSTPYINNHDIGQRFIIHTSIAREKAWINRLFVTLKTALHSTSKAEEIALYTDAKMYKLRLKKQ